MIKISTGTDLFDDFLEGGFEKDVLTTIYGPSGSGKTTLCMLASIAQARQKKKTIYIDTEGGFSIERMKQLSGNDYEEVLKHILVLKPSNLDEQKDSLNKLKNLITEKIGLIIIDTLTIYYRLELAKDSNIKNANNNLIWQLSYLKEITTKNQIPILITNQVYSDFKKRDDFKMVGGDILKYSSKCLLKLVVERKNLRKATIISNRSIPDGKELAFAIINEGFVSPTSI